PLPAGLHLAHRNVGLIGAEVEQREVPHLPVGVAGVGVVGVLDRDRPAVAQRVVDLRLDLLVGEVGQEREGALGDAHAVLLSCQATVGVTTRSGVSVDSNSNVTSFQTCSAASSSGQPRAARWRMSGPSWK